LVRKTGYPEKHYSLFSSGKNVKFTLEKSMKVQRGSRGIVVIFDLGAG